MQHPLGVQYHIFSMNSPYSNFYSPRRSRAIPQLMDPTHPMPSGTLDEAPSEALPLLHDIPFRRPYQAYCVTEASSRPPSPDDLSPKPLRTSATPILHVVVDTESADIGTSDQNHSHLQATASSPGKYVESATLRKAGQYSNRQTSLPNEKSLPESTKSGNISNHITRAVTPRGSHSLASFEVTAYDRPPSHSRMQRSASSNDGTLHKVPRKPLKRHDDHFGVHQRPLPTLPLETALVVGEHEQEIDLHNGDTYGRLSEQIHVQPLLVTKFLKGSDTKASSLYKQSDSLIPSRPLPDLPINIIPTQLSQGDVLEHAILPPTLEESSNIAYLNKPSSSPRKDDILDKNACESPAAELYVPRGHWDDVDDEARVLRRTQLRTTNSKNQFGQLSAHHSAWPPSVSLPRDSHLQPVCCLANPAPSFYSSTDIQNGPRPPPWGSYEDLAIQRRQRGDARERAQIRANRLTTDSTSVYQKSISTDSLGKDPLREVEEYREQILGVYPDMEFNGEAGRGDRRWCCCVLM